MNKSDFHWNEDADEQKIVDAKVEIENLNRRLDIQEQRLQDENIDEDEQREVLWPSLLPKDD